MFRITAIGQLLVLTSLAGLVHGVEPEDVRISSTEYLVTDQNVVGTTIQLDTTDEGEPQRFEQQGGSVRVAELLIDNGEYNISDGTLSVEQLALGDPTSDSFSMLNQGDGTLLLRADDPVSVTHLDFRSAGGHLTPMRYIYPFHSTESNTAHHIRLQRVPIFPLEFEELTLHLQYNGTDQGDLAVTFGEHSDRVLSTTFNQVGGDVQVQGDLLLCVPPTAPIIVYDLSDGTYEQMSYELSGGSLEVGGDLIVGSLGAAPTSFIQRAGHSNISGTLAITDQGSRVELLGGRMEVGSLIFNNGRVARGYNFIMHPDVELVVHEKMSYHSSLFYVPEGNTSESEPTIRLNGAHLEMTDGDIHEWVRLNLIATGGMEETTRIEAISADRGPGNSGSQMASLTIGEDEPTYVQLVDDRYNDQNDVNALYVDTLTLAPGSVLDLNRVNVYYNHLEMGEGAQIVNPSGNCVDFRRITPSDLHCVVADALEHLLSELGLAHGDLNLDGEVGFDDFLILSGNFDSQVEDYRDGDLTRDGSVGFDDFLEFSRNYTATGQAWYESESGSWERGVPSGASGFAAVPEPDLKLHLSIGLLCLAGFSLASRPAYRTAIVPQSLRLNRDHS